MNTYSETFQNITKSVEQLLTNDHNSLEIKKSATSLRESVQPCIEELKQSATRLKNLVQGCFDDLHHAEDVWNSKPRIAQAPTHEIWEQLGELSGREIRILQLGSQCKSQAIEKAKASWTSRVERLRNKWFIDANKQPKKGIGWRDKDGFIKDIRPAVECQSQELNLIIRNRLSLIFQELNAIDLKSIQVCVTLLDLQTKANLSSQINLIGSENETNFSKLTEHLPDNPKGFMYTVSPALEALVNQGWGDIYWEQVVKFKDEVSAKIEERIISIFDDRVKLATKAIAQVIAFYNDFLERQERYQQETPEQRMAEKAWIAQQWRELARVQTGIEAILNQNAG